LRARGIECRERGGRVGCSARSALASAWVIGCRAASASSCRVAAAESARASAACAAPTACDRGRLVAFGRLVEQFFRACPVALVQCAESVGEARAHLAASESRPSAERQREHRPQQPQRRERQRQQQHRADQGAL
jgi:hypothetical protein